MNACNSPIVGVPAPCNRGATPRDARGATRPSAGCNRSAPRARPIRRDHAAGTGRALAIGRVPPCAPAAPRPSTWRIEGSRNTRTSVPRGVGSSHAVARAIGQCGQQVGWLTLLSKRFTLPRSAYSNHRVFNGPMTKLSPDQTCRCGGICSFPSCSRSAPRSGVCCNKYLSSAPWRRDGNPKVG